jgi:hypothetical protein
MLLSPLNNKVIEAQSGEPEAQSDELAPHKPDIKKLTFNH